MFLFPDSVSDNCQQGEENKSDELMQRIPEEDHVEGLKFLAERDMRSLHKVLCFVWGYLILHEPIHYSTFLPWAAEMFRCRVFDNISIRKEVGGGLWCFAGKIDNTDWNHGKYVPSFLAQCLTTGLLLSGGMLHLEMIVNFRPSNHMKTSWVVVTAWSMSLALSPLLTHVCR